MTIDRDPEAPATARAVRQEREGRAGEIQTQVDTVNPWRAEGQERCELGKRLIPAPRKRACSGLESWNPGVWKHGTETAAKRRKGDLKHADATASEAVGGAVPQGVRHQAATTCSDGSKEPLGSQGKAGQGEPRGVRLRTRTDL